MDNRIGDILIEQADGLIRGVDKADDLLSAFKGKKSELEPLLGLAIALKNILIPVSADAAFADSLEHKLVQKSRQATSSPISVGRPRLPNPVWLAVAAIGSLASIVGVVAWIVKRGRVSSERTFTQPA